MPSPARHLIPILIAIALGTVVYCLALKWIWDEDVMGELAAVVFAATTSLCIAYPLIYLPAFRLLTRKLSGSRPYILFPLFGIALGVTPVMIINLRWSGNLSSMLSPESQLFYILFIAVGVVLGGAFPLVDRHYCERQRVDRRST